MRYLKRAGAGSMMISIIVHVFILGGATIWVVSSVQPARKANFQGGGNPSGPADTMRSVKMSNTQPKLDTLNKRLVVESAASSVTLPDLPPMSTGGPGGPSSAGGLGGSGSGAGAGAGLGNLKSPIMPLFGFKEAQTGGTLVGRLYDLKQFRTGKPNPDVEKVGPGVLAAKEVTSFIKSGWSSSSLYKFYQAPTALYATQIFVPVMSANEAPKAYGVEKEVQPKAWLAHYRGKVSPPVTGAYRFVGVGDDIIAVRIDGKLALDAGGKAVSDFKTDRPKSANYSYDFVAKGWITSNRGGVVVGNRLELRAGLYYDIDIVLAEGPGGLFSAMLLFEQEGVTYEKDSLGNPLLPIFRIADSKTASSRSALPFMPDGPIWRAIAPPQTTNR
ncbi:PA14 domain-containing protein [Rariglobus hedericola]|nr:PA14 domain-containing protein [Rariglobus hedericola]